MTATESSSGAIVPEAARVAFLFHRQWIHLLFVVALLPVTHALAAPALDDGSLWGVSAATWFHWSVALAVVHQIYAWLLWRLQLGWGVMTRLFGRRDLAAWCVGFVPLLLARPVLVVLLAIADEGSLAMPAWVSGSLAVLLGLPALYTGYSIHRYFGLARAVGGDHFRVEYRRMPLVTQGAFSWSPNAMYTFAFLGLWAVALAFGSHAALVVAVFQHAYIWVHYVCTEAPDMTLLYGDHAEHGDGGDGQR